MFDEVLLWIVSCYDDQYVASFPYDISIPKWSPDEMNVYT